MATQRLRKSPSEHDEQVKLIQWARLMHIEHPELDYMFAIPNGGKRHKKTAWQLQEEGLCSGVPDLFLAYPNMGFHGMYIEMKRTDGKNSSVSTTQRIWLHKLRAQGYCCVIGFGYTDARDKILAYLSGDNRRRSTLTHEIIKCK